LPLLCARAAGITDKTNKSLFSAMKFIIKLAANPIVVNIIHPMIKINNKHPQYGI
jgi:regulator of PEP synthase PpsR (kinase-PPPase family)